MTRSTLLAAALLALSTGCNDVDGDGKNPDDGNEVITTVVLSFTALGGGTPAEFTWADAENDGSPVIDDVTLSDLLDYRVSVSFLNELEDPAEDITAEVADESDEHQVFFTGDAVEGPATGAAASAPLVHAYDDEDANGNPVGLDSTLTTRATGTGDLIVTLRHMPPEDGAAVKVAGVAEDVATGGFAAIGGDNDVQVTFPVTVE